MYKLTQSRINCSTREIIPVGSNKACISMASGRPTRLSSSHSLPAWSSEDVWVLTLTQDTIFGRGDLSLKIKIKICESDNKQEIAP